MVTGLVTVNGSSRPANSENTERRHGSTLRFGWKLHQDTHTNKTINTLQQPEKDHTQTAEYYEPTTTMILDHLAFSPKLSARTVAALGGPSKAFSDDLSMKLFGSTAVFVNAAKLGNLGRKVCCLNYYKVRIVRTF